MLWRDRGSRSPCMVRTVAAGEGCETAAPATSPMPMSSTTKESCEGVAVWGPRGGPYRAGPVGARGKLLAAEGYAACTLGLRVWVHREWYQKAGRGG